MTRRNALLRLLAAAFVSCLLASSAPALDRDVVISAYQGRCDDGNFDANLASARQAVKDALARGSDFLVLPETFLSGYDPPQRGARRLNDPQLAVFIAESARHNMVVIVGMARIADEGLFNTALVIYHGRLLGTYDKIMLTKSDRDDHKFIRGGEMPIFEANGVRFAVIICADSSYIYPAMIAKLKGAEILFSPHNNDIGSQLMDAHRKWVRNCHIGLACQLRMVVARSNVVAKDKSGLGYGDSFIVSPRGDMLAEAELFRSEMITAKVTPTLFKLPYVWGDLESAPANIRSTLADLLKSEHQFH